MNTYSGTNYNAGVLANATPFPVDASNLMLPASVCLNSAAGGRLIEYSVDDGTIWQPAVLDVTTTGQLIVKVTAPIRALRFTGATGDKWFIR